MSIDERAGLRPLGDATDPEQDRLDVGRVGDDRDHDVAGGRHGGRALAQLDAELLEPRGATRRPVPGADLEAGPRGVRGHRAAHRPEPDEPDAHGNLLASIDRVDAYPPARRVDPAQSRCCLG